MKKVYYFLSGGILGILGKSVIEHKLIDLMKLESNEHKKVEKFRKYYYMLNRWLELNQHDSSIEKLLLKRNYNKIAIYGMGEIGIRLYYELQNTSIEVAFVLDQQLEMKFHEFPQMNDNNDFERIDAVVVTIPFAYEAIKKDLKKRTLKPILSLEHILYEV